MKRAYSEYFGGQYVNLRRQMISRSATSFYPPELVAQLFSAIPKDWRTDAKFFLANNILDMVVSPYDTVGATPRQPMLPGDSLWRAIFSDLDMIVARATSVAMDRARGYVSATSVVIALGQLASELKTTQFDIWSDAND